MRHGAAPRRALTGIWDAAQTLGVSGATEHPALFPGGRGQEGGREDETGVAKPLPYTPAGLEALKKNKPSGPGVRQVDSVLTNDPASGVMRHADAGYEDAIACAKQHGLDLPSLAISKRSFKTG